jgi:hypothetical protein
MASPRRSESETAFMFPKRTVRYCIQCGRDISDALFCDTPDCGSIPNFYREVPGPEQRKKQAERRAAGKSLETPRPAAAGEGRRTVPVVPGARVEAVAILLGLESSQRILIYPGRTEVGAAKPAQAIIDVPEVSTRHAMIDCVKSSRGAWEVTITDCNSTNGTYVNGKRIDSARLSRGDIVCFAVVELEFRLIPGEEGRRTLAM